MIVDDEVYERIMKNLAELEMIISDIGQDDLIRNMARRRLAYMNRVAVPVPDWEVI